MNQPARVLVVDDEEDVRVAHSRLLSARGFCVEMAESADAALARLRAAPFDVVLSDITMAGMSGLGLAKELRASKIDVPVVLVTGAPDMDTAVEAVELGILRYLRKPVDPPALATVLHEVIRVFGLARIDRLARDNEGLRSLVEELHRAQDEAQVALRCRREFLAMMSHELATPLTAVLGYTDLLLDGDLRAEPRTYAERAKSAALLAHRILKNLLDLAELASRTVQLTVGTFDPRSALGDAVARHEADARAKGLALELVVAPRLPAKLKGDAAKLAQVVEHLLSNAVKFTETGRIEVHVDCDPTREGSLLRLSVSDTGIGVPEDARAFVLEPFRQADGSSTRRRGGAGLGLAIASELARLLGGALTLESAVSVGTTVRFEAPFERSGV